MDSRAYTTNLAAHTQGLLAGLYSETFEAQVESIPQAEVAQKSDRIDHPVAHAQLFHPLYKEQCAGTSCQNG